MTRGTAHSSKMAEIERSRKNSTGQRTRCEQCKKKGGVELRFRLNPRMWREEDWRRLCRVCAGSEWRSQRIRVWEQG